MEYEELQSLWGKFDAKLANLERLNKKLIAETLINKPQKKLNWLKFQSVHGLIAGLILVVYIFYDKCKIENLNFLFFIGSILILGVIIYTYYALYKEHKLLKSFDLQNDSIITSVQKVIKLKKIIINRQKLILFALPIFSIGVILIKWNTYIIDNNALIFMIGLLTFALVFNKLQSKRYVKRIEELKRDILDLEEYKQ